METVTKINTVHMCTNCSKAFGWSASGGWQCSVYESPQVLMYYRHGVPCPFNPPQVVSKKKVFVNPIKLSKRG